MMVYISNGKITCFGLYLTSSGFDNFLAKRVLYILNWIVSIPLCICNNVLIKPSLHNTYNNSCNYYNYSTKQHVSALFGHHQAYKETPLFYKPDDGRTRPKHVAWSNSCNKRSG